MAKMTVEELAHLVVEQNQCPYGNAGVYHTLMTGLRGTDIEDGPIADQWEALAAEFAAHNPMCTDMYFALHAIWCPIRDVVP
jgi:hypothetical protein